MANAVSGIVLLLVLGGITLSPATADVFCDNLRQVAATLPKNTSSSPVHFATTVFGQAPDAVYALALCRGDIVSDSACGGCVASAFDRVLHRTPSRQQQCFIASYYTGDDCSLVYSVEDILTLTSSDTTSGNNSDDTPFMRWNTRSWGNWGNWSTDNITGDADDVAHTVGLLNELLVKTVQTAASTTPAGAVHNGPHGQPDDCALLHGAVHA